VGIPTEPPPSEDKWPGLGKSRGATYFQYHHVDHRGTGYKVTDASEAVQFSYAMDAFGRAMTPSSPRDRRQL